MPVDFKFNYSDTDYLFVADDNGDLQPHKDLKGEARTNAESVLPLAKQRFNEIRTSELEAKAKPVLSKKESKNYKAFQTAETSLLSANTLKTSLLKNIEKNLQFGALSLTRIITFNGRPTPVRADISFDDKALRDNSEKLKALSEKIKDLSAERKKSIEKKMSPITKFFHKLRQFFSGGGWRTLAERADVLKVKIDQKMQDNSNYLKLNEWNKFLDKLKAVSEQADVEGKMEVILKLNEMTAEKFRLLMKLFTDERPLSAVHIYPHLSDDKRAIFDATILSRSDWADLANHHFFNEGKPIERFNVEAFYNKFSGEYVRLLARAKYSQIESFIWRANANMFKIIQNSQNQLQSFEAWYSKKDRLKNYLNSFLKYMVRQKITKEADEPTKVLLLLKELMDLPTQQKAGVEGKIIFDQSWTQSYNQALSKAAIRDTLNRNTLSEEVVKKLEDNINCESYHLFTKA